MDVEWPTSQHRIFPSQVFEIALCPKGTERLLSYEQGLFTVS